jgi:phosphoribosylformimino-5-aminoimidazole carboxamide ribotide isomerase
MRLRKETAERMRFRPCIDIHNGKVKQIVGASLEDRDDRASENFVSEADASWFARFYHRDGLRGGHVILLNPPSSPWYEQTRAQAEGALKACPGDLMVGGGVNPGNAGAWLRAGASHVIVTSYVFSGGEFNEGHLQEMIREVGKESLVLDLSCRKKDGAYYIVTDRWQNFTRICLDSDTLTALMGECDEFLIHAADVEGRRQGPELDLVRLLREALEKSGRDFAVTYAGGIGTFDDLAAVRREGAGRIDVTIGSALDLFGGQMPYTEVLAACDR